MDKRTLGELLECSVCLESFNEYNNKVLPCQHTFCRFCLDNIVSVERRLVCPECRLSVDTRVDDLPSNVLLNRILSSFKNVPSHDHRKQRERRRRKGLSSLVDYGMKGLNMPCAKALYSYRALENGDLSFKKDDVIELLYRVDENWFVGKLDGKQGFMPSNYVQVLSPLPSSHICQAKHDFSVLGGDKNCLSFNKNDLINVIRMVDNGWLEGSLHQKVGIFPEAFVELDSKSRLLLLQNKLAPNLIHVSHYSIQESSKGDDKAELSGQSINESLMMASLGDLTYNNGSEMSMQMTSNSYSNLTEGSKLSASFSSEAGSANWIDGKRKECSEEEYPSKDLVFGGDGILPLYQAMLNYCSKSPEELELEMGKMYVVLKDKGGGWLLGKSVAKGTVGLFPLTHVKFLKNWNYLERDHTDSHHHSRHLPMVQQSNSCEDLPPSDRISECESAQKRKSANVDSLLASQETSSFSSSSSSSGRSDPPETSTNGKICHRNHQGENPKAGNFANGGQTPPRSHLRLSSIAYGVSSLIHRNMVRQKMMNKRCMSASTSRCK